MIAPSGRTAGACWALTGAAATAADSRANVDRIVMRTLAISRDRLSRWTPPPGAPRLPRPSPPCTRRPVQSRRSCEMSGNWTRSNSSPRRLARWSTGCPFTTVVVRIHRFPSASTRVAACGNGGRWSAISFGSIFGSSNTGGGRCAGTPSPPPPPPRPTATPPPMPPVLVPAIIESSRAFAWPPRPSRSAPCFCVSSRCCHSNAIFGADDHLPLASIQST